MTTNMISQADTARLTGLASTGKLPILTSRNSSESRRKLCEDMYIKIMESFHYQIGEYGSDLLTENYKRECDQTVRELLPASTLLITLQGGISRYLNGWINDYNTEYASFTECEIHDHASQTFLKAVDGAALITSSRKQEAELPSLEIYLTFLGGEGGIGQCGDCHSVQDGCLPEQDDEAANFAFNIVCEVERVGRIWQFTSNPADNSFDFDVSGSVDDVNVAL